MVQHRLQIVPGTFNVGGFTGTSSSDTYVSGFTYTPTQNKFHNSKTE
jgi:hypothetical protein